MNVSMKKIERIKQKLAINLFCCLGCKKAVSFGSVWSYRSTSCDSCGRNETQKSGTIWDYRKRGFEHIFCVFKLFKCI